MGKATWQPKWWKPETHGTGWDRVKEAMRRDWEQTKHDFKSTAGRELNQDVGDTVKQVAGSEPIPPAGQPNWDEVEAPLMYGFAARDQYGSQHATWNDKLESSLSREWDEGRGGRRWNEVRDFVRRGYEGPRN